MSQEFVVFLAAAVGAEAEMSGFGEIVNRADFGPAVVDRLRQACDVHSVIAAGTGQAGERYVHGGRIAGGG